MKTTLEDLLEWAKSLSLYIEILGDGSAEVQMMEDDENYVTYAEGETLLEALLSAQAKFVNGE